MNSTPLSRRHALKSLAARLAGGPAILPLLAGAAADDTGRRWRLAHFAADVTPPLGHPCMGGGIAPAARVIDPLSARGLVLLGAGEPLVLCAVDWCEIRNDAHAAWRRALAEACGARPERVLVASVHQHDAPVADLEAERILRAASARGSVCDPEFHAQAVERTARAARESLAAARPVTRIGLGKARVEMVASNRRYQLPDGTISHGRMSACRDPLARAADEGTIDPLLRTISFWDGERPLAALSAYATHPMSHYGQGLVSADFVGLARQAREAELPGVAEIYFSGASGNVTAGKFNDGSPENRPLLAERLRRAMAEAWRETRAFPLKEIRFRSEPLRLAVRDGPGWSEAELRGHLAGDSKPFAQCLAAMGLSSRRRSGSAHLLDLPALEFLLEGSAPAHILLLPGESYVEFQLLAQSLRPGDFVLTCGYGECAPGYIPIERAWEEKDTNLHDWCWVAPGAERAMREAIARALSD